MQQGGREGWCPPNSTFPGFLSWIPKAFWYSERRGPRDCEIISRRAFVLSLWDGLTVSCISSFPPPSSCHQTPLSQRGRGRDGGREPCLPTPPSPSPVFVITKEQTHIKHTQGAAAVIAVSPGPAVGGRGR